MRHRPLVSRVIIAALAAAAALVAGGARAAQLVEVTVINRATGERLTPFHHGGRVYVAGAPGDRYALELRNRSGQRLMTVVSVDGVNVLTGETAASRQSGYVLDPWRGYRINGWRKSMDEVAQFFFTALPDSYAARTGRPDHVGVIGVAVFRAKAEPAAPRAAESWRDVPRRQAGESAARDSAEGRGDLVRQEATAPASKAEGIPRPNAVAQPSAERLGTGHGERESSPTTWTDFVRASDSPNQVITIHYDSRSNLIARGIIRSPRLPEPNPFPAGIGFVPDPHG